jgi:hypothetical protein
MPQFDNQPGGFGYRAKGPEERTGGSQENDVLIWMGSRESRQAFKELVPFLFGDCDPQEKNVD